MSEQVNKTIDTLVDDIYSLFGNIKEFNEDNVLEFGHALSKKISYRISEERQRPTLRLSNLGKPCDRELWYSINSPELAEPLPPQARIKFLFGDILEELLLFLAKEAGHKVERRQDEVDLYGIKGHIDAVIDNRLVDVKSASTYSFRKFREHSLPSDDPFGYIIQLDGYLEAVQGWSEVKEKDVASFLVIDKTLGHITLDTYPKSDLNYKDLINSKRAMLALNYPPPRSYDDIPEGKSGNRKLGTKCSYCSFKQTCWPGLRLFSYANKPLFLTHVVKEPKVPEIKFENQYRQTEGESGETGLQDITGFET